MTIIVNANSDDRTTISMAGSRIAASEAERRQERQATKVPTMNTSPWAKLMSSMIP